MIKLWQCLLDLPLVVRLGLFISALMIWTALCLWPSYDDTGVALINDKLAHFIGNFGMFGVLIIWRQRLPLLLGIGLVFTYSVAIEYLQISIPGRFFDYYDMVANGSGALVAAILVRFLQLKIRVERGFI